MTSTLYLPASPGNDDQLGKVVTTCYPVTTCSEFTVTLTMPPESCTTYTTTNEFNNQVEKYTEPVSWWKPSFQTPTQLAAAESQDSVPEISDSPGSGPGTDNLSEPDAGRNASPQPGDKIFSSPETRPNNLALPCSNAAQSDEGVKDSGPVSGDPGFSVPVESPEKYNFSQSGKSIDSQKGSSSSVPNEPPGAALEIGNTASDASDERAGVGTPSAVAQAIGCRARKTTAAGALIVVVGITLLLVYL